MKTSRWIMTMAALAVLVVLLFAGMFLLAAPGDLDISFGTDGVVITDFQEIESEGIEAITLDSDGKIIAVGGGGAIELARYNPDGSLDISFGGGDGIVFQDTVGNEYSEEVELDSQSRIVVSGEVQWQNGDYDAYVRRFYPDGTLDTTFDQDGLATTSLTYFDLISSMTIDSSDRILLSGETYENQYDLILLRYLPDGTLDTSFSNDGIVRLDIDGGYEDGGAIELLEDGRILVMGPHTGGIFLARFNDDGTLDATFGEDGISFTEFFNYHSLIIADITIDPLGRIVAAGAGSDTIGILSGLVLRYTSDGVLDPGFSDDGILFTSGKDHDQFLSIDLDSEGRIVTVGLRRFNDEIYMHSLVARFNPEGSEDSTFGNNGILMDLIPTNIEFIRDGKLDASGHIMVVGGTNATYDHLKFLLIRLEGGGPLITATSSNTPSPTSTPTNTYTPTSTLPPSDTPVCVPTMDSSNTMTPYITCGEENTYTPDFTPNETFTPEQTLEVTTTHSPDATATPEETLTETPTAIVKIENGDFEDPDMTFWKIRNATGDRIQCNKAGKPPVAFTGICAFRFKSSQNEKSKLIQIVDLSHLKFNPEDQLVFEAWISAHNISTSGKVSLKYSLKNGQKGKLETVIVNSAAYKQVRQTLNVGTNKIAKVKIEFLSLSTTGKIYVDTVTLTLNSSDISLQPLPAFPNP